MARRFIWLAVLIVIVIAAYTYGWNWAASRLVAETQAQITALNQDGRRANCEDPQARGYPFRIGLFCRSVVYVDPQYGVSVRAGALRSAAQVYQPWRIVGELDGPAILEFPALNAMEITWASLQASTRISTERRPDILSVAISGIAIGPDSAPAGERPRLSADGAEFHARPSGEATDVAWRFERLALAPELTGDGALPLLSGDADLRIDADQETLAGLRTLRGLGGTINGASLRTAGGETALRAQGPVSVGEDGLIDAQLTLTLENPEVFARLLSELVPSARDQIRLAFMGVAALGSEPQMPLSIQRGVVSIGFLRLGQLPPL